MVTPRTIVLVTVPALVALTFGVAAAAPTLSSEYRYAAQVGEYFVRGDAAVSESPVLRRGLRLAAWDAADEQDATRMAVATAVYFFQVPEAARTVTIEVGYQRDEAAQNRDIAGFLFVRNQAIEQQFADAEGAGKRPAEEPGFFGNTYLLPAAGPRVTITLPAEGHVINGILEVHLSAGAGQVFDAQYLQVTALGAEVPVQIHYVAADSYIPDPYQFTYYYYYAGPCYYPHGAYYASFNAFSFDPIFWGYAARRACYYSYHNWVHRPAAYCHRPLVAVHRPFYVIRPPVAAYRHNWYLRNFGLDGRHLGDRDLDVIIRRRTAWFTPGQLLEQRRYAQQVAEIVHRSEQEFRTHFGDRIQERLAAWHRNPAEATRDIRTLPRTPQLQTATNQWAALRPQWRDQLDGPPRRPIPTTQPPSPRLTAPTVTPAAPSPTPTPQTTPRPPRQPLITVVNPPAQAPVEPEATPPPTPPSTTAGPPTVPQPRVRPVTLPALAPRVTAVLPAEPGVSLVTTPAANLPEAPRPRPRVVLPSAPPLTSPGPSTHVPAPKSSDLPNVSTPSTPVAPRAPIASPRLVAPPTPAVSSPSMAAPVAAPAPAPAPRLVDLPRPTPRPPVFGLPRATAETPLVLPRREAPAASVSSGPAPQAAVTTSPTPVPASLPAPIQRFQQPWPPAQSATQGPAVPSESSPRFHGRRR